MPLLIPFLTQVGIPLIVNLIASFIFIYIDRTILILVVALPVSVLIGIVLYFVYKHKLDIHKSGIDAYYKKFKLEYGPEKYWSKVKNSFCYLGCGGGSILNHLKTFIGNEKGSNKEYFILLMNPKGKYAERQICFNLGYSYPVTDPDKKEQVAKQLLHLENQYNTTISGLQTLAPYSAKPQRLKIRVYDEFTPWWMYIIDQKSMVLGILRRNNVNENKEPVVVLSEIKDQANLFSSFKQNFERIWESATPVEETVNGTPSSP